MRFGVLGTAAIATGRVIPAIQSSEHEVAAIASRDADRAARTAAELGIPTAFGGYGELLETANVDAVYIPLPNGLHAEWIRRAADAGLHVLCEKPLTDSAEETAAVFEYCAARDVTLMEAFMYRFHPRTERAIEIVEGELGTVTSVTATATYPVPPGADDVRLDAALAGGSVMDVGCYAASAVQSFLGQPDRVYATMADPRETGVDTRAVGVLEYGDDVAATLTSGFDTPDTQYYRVQTTDGWLESERSFWIGAAEPVELTYATGERTATEAFEPVDDYRLEVEHFAECVRTGIAPRVNRDESVATARIVDALYQSADADRSVDLQ